MGFHREIFRESKEADAELLQIKLKCFLILSNSYHIIVASFVFTIFHQNRSSRLWPTICFGRNLFEGGDLS